MNNIELPNRLVKLRKILGLTQKQFGKKIGKSHNTIINWENSKTPFPDDMVNVVSGLLNVNPLWLLCGEGDIFLKSPDQNTVNIEVLTYAGLGNTYNLENLHPIEIILLPRDLVTNKGKVITKAIRCVGDSMHPTIVDGGLVGIDFEDREPVENGIFLLRFPDIGLAIKRLQIKIDGYLLVADNPMIKDELITKDQIEEGIILGRVRWIINKV